MCVATIKACFSLGKAHGRFIADFIGLLRCDLTGLKGLSDLIGDHIMSLRSASDILVLSLGKQKFLVTGLCITGIGADIFSILCFRCIFGIIGTICQTLRHRLSLIDMQRNESCCCHFFISSIQSHHTKRSRPNGSTI